MSVELVAKNVEDLKKKLPEVAALYQQFTSSQQRPGMQIPGFGFGNLAGGKQAFSSNITIQGGTINGNGGNSEMLKQQLNELKQRMAGNPLMQQLLD